MPLRIVIDELVLTVYVDAAGLDQTIERLRLLQEGSSHVHLTEFLVTSEVRSGRPVATDVDVVLVESVGP